MQEFVINGRLPSYNDLHNGGWQKTWAKKRDAMAVVGIAALSIKPITDPVTITIACYEPDKRRDADNVLSGATKVILDALQKYGKLPNDNRHWVTLKLKPVKTCSSNPRIEVYITDRLEDLTDE